MAISGGEQTRAEQAYPVDLTGDASARRGVDSGGRMLSVVVPLLNEEATLEQLYKELEAALASTELEWEVVFVDDGSTDGSYRELVRLHAAHLNVRVVRLRRNFGKAAALAAGIEVAAGEVIVTMDADLQDDPAEIPNLVAKLDEGFDVVSGWKCDRHDPFVRRFVSRIYNTATRLATGVKLHDMNCGLKAYRAEVFEHVQLYGERHRFVPVLAHHLGFSVTELPVNHRARENGHSRFGIERYLRAPFDLLTIVFMGRYRNRPLHLFGGIGLMAVRRGRRHPRLSGRDQERRLRRSEIGHCSCSVCCSSSSGMQFLSLGLSARCWPATTRRSSGGRSGRAMFATCSAERRQSRAVTGR